MIGPRRTEQLQRIVVGVTGASGCVITLRLCEVLNSLGFEIEAVVSRRALTVADYECVSRNWFLSKLRTWVRSLYSDDDLDAPLASSSYRVDGCVIAPATINTLAKIVNGIGDNLVVRTALNVLRMQRPLVAVVRESPLSVVELRTLYMAAKMGISIVPAVVGFYAHPQTIRDIVDFIVGKVLDVLGIENELYTRWHEIKLSRSRSRDPCQILYESESP